MPTKSAARSAKTCALRSSTLTLIPNVTLVTLKRDCDLPIKFEDLAPKEEDAEALTTLFGKLGFKSWLAELNSRAAGDGTPDGAGVAFLDPYGDTAVHLAG